MKISYRMGLRQKLETCFGEPNTCRWHALLLFVVATYLIYPLLGDGYFVGHEALGPQYRAYGIGLAVASGQFPAKVLPNLVNGLGYGWNIFYSPLAYDLTWLISTLGFSYITSSKLIHFLGILLSGVFIYLLMMRITGRSSAALIAAVLYMTAPYRLVDLYARNAYAESFAFVFLPVVFLGVYEVFHGDPRRWWVLAMGMAGIVLTHNISGMYCALFVAAYGVTQIRRMRKEVGLLRSLGLALLMSTLLTAYFIGPFLEHKATHSYAIFDPDIVGALGISADNLRDHAVKWKQLWDHEFRRGWSQPLASDKPEMSFLLGVPLVLFAAVGAYATRRHSTRTLFRFCFVAAVLSLAMVLEGFPWQFMPEFLYYVQFPWRLLMFATFFLSLLGGAAVLQLPEKYHRALVMVPLVGALCVYVFSFIKPDYREFLSDARIPVIEDIHKSNSNIGTSKAEYLPIRSLEHIDHLRQHNGDPMVLSGAAELVWVKRFGTNLSIDVALSARREGEGDVVVELPFVHYLGYKATLRTPDGATHALSVVEGPNGLSTVTLRNSGRVTAWYGVTRWSPVAYAMTLVGLAWLVLLLVRSNPSLSARRA